MSLSARAIALAANTPCPRLDTLAAAGHSDTSTASFLGYETKSPRLAYAVGVAFEKRITSDPQKLTELLGAYGGVTVTIDAEHGDETTYQQTLTHLADPTVSMVLQGVVPGPFGGWLRPDVLYRAGNTWEVGEIKVYLDKDTETSTISIGQAVTQAAISARALTNAGVQVSEKVTIILSTLTGAPTARRFAIAGELARIDALLERTSTTGQTPTVEPFAPGGEHIYSIRCVGACALAEYCATQLQETGVRWPSIDLPAKLGASEAQLLEAALNDPVAQAAYQAAIPLGAGAN